MVRSTRILRVGLAALAVAGLALAGCAGTTGSPPAASPTIAPDPDLGAAWLDSGRMIGLVTLGSSTCVPGVEDEPSYTDGVLHVELAAAPARQACTADIVPRVTLVDLPDGVDPAEDLDIEVTGEDYFGQVELDGVDGLDPSGATEYVPSAGWATVDGQFVILTWGSSTCIPVIEDIAATGPAQVTVTYATPPADQACTMDMVGQGAIGFVSDLQEDDDVELILAGGTFLGVSVPIYGSN